MPWPYSEDLLKAFHLFGTQSSQEPKDHCTFFIVAYALSLSNENPNQPYTSTVYRFYKVEKHVFNERLKVTTQKKIKQKVDSPQNELEHAVNNDEEK